MHTSNHTHTSLIHKGTIVLKLHGLFQIEGLFGWLLNHLFFLLALWMCCLRSEWFLLFCSGKVNVCLPRRHKDRFRNSTFQFTLQMFLVALLLLCAKTSLTYLCIQAGHIHLSSFNWRFGAAMVWSSWEVFLTIVNDLKIIFRQESKAMGHGVGTMRRGEHLQKQKGQKFFRSSQHNTVT